MSVACRVSAVSSEGLEHRNEGYEFLRGEGLEIGAFHQPAPVPQGCQVTYCDAHTKEEAIELFPELSIHDLVTVDRVCDLDTEGLSPFADECFDFVILNHVVEHVANPIRVIRELFRITKWGGRVVVSAPDKEFTFDKDRDLTPFAHLLADYRNNVTEVSDEHYVDFLMGVYPTMVELDEKELAKHVAHVKQRREHAHVWNSSSFKEFLVNCFEHIGVSPVCLFESAGQDNQFEYFSVWDKEEPQARKSLFRRVLGDRFFGVF